ncbi:conserved hypothetical protein [Microsporum canis CBS 113480]|uniref:Aminoglycoside phosphotransferase domain-containing protein n=1 Tax=Arthroderma otae (strain ATCC MYA-4605 / CBS 113480) TaxID=554155 RepID=C5FT70_ARTOC|nr:conserved hypothetical protein [Microsporum canis CBS 113480]EEQ33073.1 conserved hypothetical protein [Microsporum canis CBS 113480]
MSFDFDSYFKQLDPQNTWTVKRLTGGLVNLTVRASKSQNEESLYVAAGKAGRFGNSQSLILKYAPPFVASVGEAAPFDQARQTFGQFFADLHAEGTLNLIKPHGTDPKLTRFDNSSMKEVVRRAAVSTMKPYLGQFNCADAEKLGQVVEEDFDREAVWDGEQCFNVGDLWPGGILIESSPAAAKFPKLGVIDFEFSGPGRGVNGDMAQLLAHLHLYYIAWGYCVDPLGLHGNFTLLILLALVIARCNWNHPRPLLHLPTLVVYSDHPFSYMDEKL